MADVVVVGAGLGGVPMAFELRQKLRPEDRVVVVSNAATFHFTPSNPWVAVGWRQPGDIRIPLAPVFGRFGIAFESAGLRRLDPASSTIELGDGRTLRYDYLVIATGPELAFDEVPGLGPEGGHTQSVCHVDHAARAAAAWEAFVAAPGPMLIGATQGASCFGPAYEFALIADADLRRRRIRDRVPITFVTSEPYVGHLGLGGVGDTKSMLESRFRDRDIRWICNARVDAIEAGVAHVSEIDEDGAVRRKTDVGFSYGMLMPPFRGIAPLRGVEGLTNPRGFVQVDRHQQNARWPNVFAVGVCVAIAPTETTPVPVGVPKTGFMIELMVTATAENIRALLDGRPPAAVPTLNAVCLADFGDSGVAFVAMPQVPPRNVNWSSEGRWVHLAKIAFEKYFMHKVRNGITEPAYEKYVLELAGIRRLKV